MAPILVTIVPTSSLLLFAIAALAASASAPAFAKAPQYPAPVQCREWRECRQLALDAAARGEHETFHDLAWRSVQTGPPRDPDLMYLLARAQCLSGRPDDALVMLRRLADMGVSTDAATNGDFRRARALPGWPEVEAIIQQGVRHTDASARPTADPASRAAPLLPELPTPPTPGAPAPPPPPLGSPSDAATFRQASVEVVARFSTQRFAPGGLAYDVVSSRFLFGDYTARKLMVVAEGSDHTIDMVGPDSAGFHRVMAIEIDARRGDLWVVSAVANGGAAALHKLQLVSGRPLAIFAAPAELEPLALRDVAVTGAGTALVLDGVGRRVLALEPGKKTLELLMQIDADDPASLTPAGDERVAYVAHRTGIVRLDLKYRSARDVAAPAGIVLGGFERLRWYRNTLVGVQTDQDGSRRIVRLELDRTGRSVTTATVIDASLPVDTGPTFATISGDDLYYMMTRPDDGHVEGVALLDSLAEVSVRRIRLR